MGKIVGAVLLAGALLTVSWSFLQPVLTADEIPDQGRRPLVVLSMAPSDRQYDTFIDERISASGELRITFFIRADGVNYGEGIQDGFSLDYAFTVAGLDDSGQMRCGGSEEALPSAGYDELSPGSRHAADIDEDALQNSATNFGNVDADYSAEDQSYAHTTGTLWALPQTEYYSERRTSGEMVFAESCELPPSSVWRWPPGRSFDDAPHLTLLLPQVNLTAEPAGAVNQRDLTVFASIQRAEGLALTESYPTVAPSAYSWAYQMETYEAGNREDEFYVRYTDQPVLIFTDRQASKTEALDLLWAGTALGIAGALIVSALSRTFDLITRGLRGDQKIEPWPA